MIEFGDDLVNKILAKEASSLEVLSSVEKIKSVVWSCDPSKVPSLNEFNLNFVRKCWDIIGSEFCDCVL